VNWNVIPFKKRKKKLDWLQGVTPRKKAPPPGRRRIPPALPGGLVIAALIAMVLWLPADASRVWHVLSGWAGQIMRLAGR
jgi:hypothetical protein